jgi:biopolymer transport protein ExbB/TolQ
MQKATPYAAPLASAKDIAMSERRWRRARLISGLSTLAALMAGVTFTVIGMNRAFVRIAEAEHVDPAGLAEDISIALSIGMVTTPVAIVGFIVWILATVKVWRSRANIASGRVGLTDEHDVRGS